ncbi:MAG: TIGR02281 family clan AA aspartic protease [Caulobacteraceae bacterium]
MLKFAAAIAVGALAMGAAQAVARMDRASGDQPEPAPAPVLRAATLSATPAAGSATALVKAADGHYWAEGDVSGQRVRFLVDTGATVVALTPEDAHRLGFRDADLDYSASVSTANGQARAARIQLASLSVAGAKVEKVDAVVISRGLPASLLGMTYLGRLSRIEATPTALILRP